MARLLSGERRQLQASTNARASGERLQVDDVGRRGLVACLGTRSVGRCARGQRHAAVPARRSPASRLACGPVAGTSGPSLGARRAGSRRARLDRSTARPSGARDALTDPFGIPFARTSGAGLARCISLGRLCSRGKSSSEFSDGPDRRLRCLRSSRWRPEARLPEMEERSTEQCRRTGSDERRLGRDGGAPFAAHQLSFWNAARASGRLVDTSGPYAPAIWARQLGRIVGQRLQN